MIETIVSAVLGITIGAVLSFVITRNYYRKSSRDLREAVDELKVETADLRKLNTIMLNALEAMGVVKLNRNAEGNIVGRRIELTASILSGSVTSTGDLSIEHHKGTPNE